MKTSNLDEWVAYVDSIGGITSLSAEQKSEFSLIFETAVDKNLDPFSAEYHSQMASLYSEISNRKVDQETGEHVDFDFKTSLEGANPYGSVDIAFISRHVEAASKVMRYLELPPKADILDLGSGWGLTSEIFSYCGAKVKSVDINPSFVKLNNSRFQKLGYISDAEVSNFDNFRSPLQFDAIVFYESLHHSLDVTATIKNVKQFLKPETGKIVFAGEPINNIWWPNWGVRLDAESVYVMHKFGWFESGWSKEYITEVFYREGFDANWIIGGGLDNGDLAIFKDNLGSK